MIPKAAVVDYFKMGVLKQKHVPSQFCRIEVGNPGVGGAMFQLKPLKEDTSLLLLATSGPR